MTNLYKKYNLLQLSHGIRNYRGKLYLQYTDSGKKFLQLLFLKIFESFCLGQRKLEMFFGWYESSLLL